MSCRHRFYQELSIPQTDLEYLFIGTFNPEWEAENGNNAEYFYGRETSQFWCILPHAFNKNCLIDKGSNEWKLFCKEHHIGLTDIIKEVKDAEKDKDYFLIMKYEDKILENFSLDFNTETILDIIAQNKNLKGIYFTRKTFNDIPSIRGEWEKIKSRCNELNYDAKELPSPSYHGARVKSKIEVYRGILSTNKKFL